MALQGGGWLPVRKGRWGGGSVGGRRQEGRAFPVAGDGERRLFQRGVEVLPGGDGDSGEIKKK